MCLIWENIQTFYENEMANKTPLVYTIFRLVMLYKSITYVVEVGSDNWIAYGLIEQCHFKYALIQFCFLVLVFWSPDPLGSFTYYLFWVFWYLLCFNTAAIVYQEYPA